MVRRRKSNLPKWRYEFDCRKCDNIREVHDPRKGRDGDYSGTIIAVIPAALRAVLKSVTKYTDNTANGGGSTASYITATTDYFFLLSEFEVFGSISYGNTNEKNKQAQYAYYSAGNSKIKYKHNGTSTAAFWWLRSPRASNSSSFVSVNTDGTVNYNGADYSLGFAPGFCV